MRKNYISIAAALLLIALLPSCRSEVNKTLIITGQSSHNWMESSETVKQILDETGLFRSKIILTPPKGEDMSGFDPAFMRYDLVVIDYEGDQWPENTVTALTDYVKNGGGVVLFNSVNSPLASSFDSVSVTRRTEFEVRTVNTDHPVTKGLPVRWLHPDDVLTRGIDPAGEEGVLLATASAGQGGRMTLPVMAARTLGEGRIFVTMLGTPDEEGSRALHCAGFITTLQRGAEWAATGSVTQELPSDFPTAAGSVVRSGFKAIDSHEAFENIASYDISQSTKYFTWLQTEIRKASGDEVRLLELEKKMVEVLKNTTATAEAKRLIIRELSWMGSDYCLPVVKELSSVEELKDDVDFALERLQ
ncbi:MAG: ThuA domain-containing protein [Bacteroidales bacterium]|nr:ThuA domain-containing protein [Bacteroidales bacterium]MBN2633157.1 ThuA domain-containing protein [Bacteroidales bacterium]